MAVETTVAILGGSGELGQGLGVALARAGVRIRIGSRELERAVQAAEAIRASVADAEVEAATNADAVSGAELIVVAVPFATQAGLLKDLKAHVSDGQVVLDATVPLATAVGGRPTHLLGVWQGSAAQQARSILPSTVGVVSGLHTLSAADLLSAGRTAAQDTLICGDSKEDKALVSSVIGLIDGIRVVDAGPLAMSRLVEGLTPLLIGINIRHKVHAGIQITGL
jgi:NADPH-dependent F420 reductase